MEEHRKHKVREPTPNLDAAKRPPPQSSPGEEGQSPWTALQGKRGTEVPSKVKQGEKDLGEKKPATLPKEQAHSLHKPWKYFRV